MAKRYKVYGIGNAIVDIQFQVEEAVVRDFGLKKGGMTLVDAATQATLIQSLGNRDHNQASGGSAANTIIALAELDAPVSYSCVVGADHFGTFYLKEMVALRVALQTDPRPRENTGTCLVLITPDAERTMVTHLGATAGFDKNDVNEAHLAQAEWMYVEGYLLSTPAGQMAVQHAVTLAKKHGVKIALTFSDAFIVENYREVLEELVLASDFIFANLAEARAFSKKEDHGDVFSALQKRAKSFALTLGEQGARVCYREEDCQVQAYRVKAVDETGAGDSFAAGLLYGMTHGFSLEKSAQLGCFLASRVVSRLGPRLEKGLRPTLKAAGFAV